MSDYYDPLYGPLQLSPLDRDLLSQPELQRLRWVNHLTFVYMTFPSAKYSRYEHTLGTLGLLTRSLRYLNLTELEELTLRVAVLLHDLGQGPFCQAYNDLLKRLGGKSNVQSRTVDILKSRSDKYVELFGRCEEVRHTGISGHDFLDKVIEVLERRPPQLAKLVFGGVGLDRIEYFMRDSRYTGVSPGRIDIAYLLKDLERRQESPFLIFSFDALASLEAVLMRRGLLYYLVYSNPLDRRVQSTMVRILEGHFNNDIGRAVSCLQWTDGQMWAAVRQTSTKANAIYEGKFPKSVMFVRKSEKEHLDLFRKLEDLQKNDDGLREIEEKLRKELYVELGDVVLDYDAPLVQRDIEDIAVRDGEQVKSLDSTDVANACRAIEDRLVICGLYCSPELDEQKVRSTFTGLIGL